MTETYTKAQICLNGHVVTAYAESSPARLRKFCPKCGEPTIRNCSNTECNAKINGKLCYDYAPVKEDLDAPAFCHECGKAYPWTERNATALSEAIDESELSEEERDKLKLSIPDVINDTPKTQTAVSRFGKAIRSAGQFGGKLLYDVLVKVATEAVVRSLTPPQ